MRSELFSAENLEKESAQPGLRLQNSKMLKVELNGEVMARTGAMVAYQGQVQFQALGSGGVGKWLKSKLTGEGVPLMKMTGRGDVFLADRAADIHLIDLEPGDALSINGANVLAFESTLQYDIKMVQGMGMLSIAGLFNCVFTGQGRIAITTKGTPVVLHRRPAHLRRPAGRDLLVGQPADRLPPRRPARPRHAARPHHRRGVHDELRRPGLRRRPAVGGAARRPRRRGQRPAAAGRRARRPARRLSRRFRNGSLRMAMGPPRAVGGPVTLRSVRGDIFKAENMAQPPTQAGMSLQHSKCVKYAVNGEVMARQGAMVAFRGNLQFEVKSQGVGNFLKRAVTGEGLSLMAVRGQGEVWFADAASDCHILDIEPNDALSINGRNVLCFDPSLRYDIQLVRAPACSAAACSTACSPVRASSRSSPRAPRSSSR